MSKAKTRDASDGELTREQIILAAEEALTRFGPMKTTVVDVARILGVSHGSVYRHFDSKAALRRAVIEKWLATFTSILGEVATRDTPPRLLLKVWLDTLRDLKTSKYEHELELFTTYRELLIDIGDDTTSRYYDGLTAQIASILIRGVAAGDFPPMDIQRSANGVLNATIKFHHPRHASEWSKPTIDVEFENVWFLILNGLLMRDAADQTRVAA